MTSLPSFAAVRARATLFGGRKKRSTLHAWMGKNWRWVRRGLADGEMGWEGLVKAMAELGLTDGHGKAPTLRCAQDTFYKVMKERERVGRRQ